MKELLSYAGTMAVVVVLAILFSLVLYSCIESPLQPVAPSYETQLSLQVLNKAWFFGDFHQKDTTRIPLNTDSTFSYLTTQSAKPVQIDSIEAKPTVSSLDVLLGLFNIGTLSPLSTNVYAITDLGMPSTLPGGFAGSFSARPIQIIDTAKFDYVSVANGSLTLTVTNNLPIPISFPNGIILKNNWSSPSDTNTVAVFSIPGTLNQGQSATATTSVAGKLLRGMLTTDSVKINATNSGGAVSILPTDSITISFQSTVLRSDSALAVIPSQTIPSDSNSVFTVDDSTTISDAIFKSGTLAVAINNNLTVSASVHVEIYGLTTTSGLPIDATLTGKQTMGFALPMSGAHITPNITVGTMGTHVSYSVGITIIDSRGAKKSVTRHDFVHADLQPGQTLIVHTMMGNIKPQYVDVNSGSKPDYNLKDADKFKAQLQLQGMKLDLSIFMPEGGFPYDYKNIWLIAKNSKHASSDSLRITDGRIDPNQSPQTPIDLSKEPTFDAFVDYIIGSFPDLPDSFNVKGYLIVNPKDEYEKYKFHLITDTSKAYPELDMNIKSNIGIANGHLDEAYNIDINQSTISSFTRGALNFEFTNQIPMKISFKMNFLKWNPARTRNDTLPVNIPTDTISAGDYNTTIQRTSPHISRFSIVLTKNDFDQISQADSIGVKLDIETSNGGTIPVVIRTDDYIRLRSSINARYIVNKP